MVATSFYEYPSFFASFGIGGAVHEVETLRQVCRFSDLRVMLAVPYSDKDSAKELGARWDGIKKVWYVCGNGSRLNSFIRWSKSEDRIYLNCADSERSYAIARGAFMDGSDRLFIPNWSWIDSSRDECIRRLCYWLPSDHPDFKSFSSTIEAANWLITNCGYMPVNQYLPDEREYLLSVARPNSPIYIYGDATTGYFRAAIWDTY